MIVQVNGVSLNYEASGKDGAPWITFSNSLASDFHMWDEQVGVFGRSFRVLRYDMRGHGGSEAVPGPYTFPDLIGDVISLWDHLGIEETFYVGCSIGGMTALGIALEHPDRLRAMVISNSMARCSKAAANAWDERVAIAKEQGMSALVESTLERWFTRDFMDQHPDKIEPIRHMIAGTSVDGYEGCIRAIQTLAYLDRLNAVSTPTLLIAGAQDPGTPPIEHEAMHERIPGSKYALLDPAGHISNVEQADEYNRLVGDFLAGLTSEKDSALR
jgi:3-oxoadipate enol-lactonase